MQNKKVSPKNVSSNTVFIAQVFFLLYFIVGLTPLFGAMDYDAPEWLYISLVNIGALIFIYKNKEDFHPFRFQKHTIQYFLILIGFFAVGCLSMLNAINVSESLVHLARLVNIIVAFYCLYVFIRKNPKSFFDLMCKIAIILLAYFTWRAVRYFIGNHDRPRTFEFLMRFPHNFSNINIYTAFVIVQLPFAMYGFLYFKKIWKYAASLVILMASFALCVAGSRTALLSFLIIMVLLIAFLIYGILKHKMNFKKELIALVLMPVVSIVVIATINKVDKNAMNGLNDIFHPKSADFYQGDKAVASNVANVQKLLPNLKNVEIPYANDSGRFSLWNLAYVNFKENPILGVGYGNYKAVGKKEHYINYVSSKATFANPRRAHSDFLEKLAETGIIGFLLYVALFLFPLLLFIKIMRREKDFTQQFFFFIVFLSALAYTFDALLNFPLERAPVQLFFVLAVVFVLIGFRNESEEKTDTKHGKFQFPIMIVLFLMSLSSVASNYLVFKSYKLQRTMREDLMGKTLFTDEKLKNSFESIQKQWTDYPQLSYVGTIKDVYLANYAIKAKKYDKALEILNNAKDHNKDAFLVKAFKSEIYLNVYDNLDSVKFFSGDVFENYPAFKTNYKILKKVYKKEKDSVGLFRVMNRYTKINYVDVDEWIEKANETYNYSKNSDRMLKILDTALVFNPNSDKLLKAKQKILGNLNFKKYLSKDEVKAKHQEAYEFFKKQKYQEARKIYLEILKGTPSDYLSIQNIGIIDLVKKDYKSAITYLSRVIAANAFQDGKAEYSRGYCYEQLKLIEKAKADYRSSRKKNYAQAMALPKERYE